MKEQKENSPEQKKSSRKTQHDYPREKDVLSCKREIEKKNFAS